MMGRPMTFGFIYGISVISEIWNWNVFERCEAWDMSVTGGAGIFGA